MEQSIGQFYLQFFGVVNVAGMVIQPFLVSRIIKYFGVRVGVMLLPCLAFGAYNILVIVASCLVLAFFIGREYARLARTGSQPGSRPVGARDETAQVLGHTMSRT